MWICDMPFQYINDQALAADQFAFYYTLQCLRDTPMGLAIGAAAGAAGGYLYDRHEKSKEKAYEEGYKEGQKKK